MKKLLREVIEHWDDDEYWGDAFADRVANIGVWALILYAVGWIVYAAIVL